jgi:hypothetical protein
MAKRSAAAFGIRPSAFGTARGKPECHLGEAPPGARVHPRLFDASRGVAVRLRAGAIIRARAPVAQMDRAPAF